MVDEITEKAFERADLEDKKHKLMLEYLSSRIPFELFNSIYGELQEQLDYLCLDIDVKNSGDTYKLSEDSINIIKSCLNRFTTHAKSISDTENDVMLGIWYQYVNTKLPKGVLAKWLTDKKYKSFIDIIYTDTELSVIASKDDLIFLNVDLLNKELYLSYFPLCN